MAAPRRFTTQTRLKDGRRHGFGITSVSFPSSNFMSQCRRDYFRHRYFIDSNSNGIGGSYAESFTVTSDNAWQDDEKQNCKQNLTFLKMRKNWRIYIEITIKIKIMTDNSTVMPINAFMHLITESIERWINLAGTWWQFNEKQGPFTGTKLFVGPKCKYHTFWTPNGLSPSLPIDSRLWFTELGRYI